VLLRAISASALWRDPNRNLDEERRLVLPTALGRWRGHVLTAD
jgi:hypothetical protein